MIAFQLTTFSSAFLLFLVQPLIAKQILPWFGGAPAVWSTCLVFFQLALVVGYGYAHLTRRFGVARQAFLHAALLLVAMITLPVTASASFKPIGGEAPTWRVLELLTTSVGFPYVLLAATAPMLQDWYARARPGQVPYWLYALSNLGSLLALLSFPVLIERYFDGRAQSVLWSVGFGLFALSCGWCGWWAARQARGNGPAVVAAASTADAAPTALDRVLWLSLSACGTGLLLAVTNQLCQEVATVPLLWILPLAVYLISFIVSFARFYRRWLWLPLFVASIVASGYVLADAAFVGLATQGTALMCLLATACMVCHGELARLKPAVGHVTAFYLALSIGGSAGGLFVALAAPVLFQIYAELPFFVLFALGLQPVIWFRDRSASGSRHVPAFLTAVPLAAFLTTTVVVLQSMGHAPGTVAAGRNFYGVLRVIDGGPNETPRLRSLFHGRVLHGAQFLDPSRKDDLTIDFARGSGIERAFSQHPRRLSGLPLRVGVIGLGAGTIAAFGRPGDSIRFFELNPQVITFARTYFTFLTDSSATVDVVPGDARLSLEAEMLRAENRHTYDLLVVDAFAGASIPVHLLTRESFAIYRQALATDGVLAIHVSNQHLDLTGVVRGGAEELGLTTAHVTREADARTSTTRSEWMIASQDGGFVTRMRDDSGHSSEAPVRVWTDAFSSLTSVMR